jgi:hypothetical protein
MVCGDTKWGTLLRSVAFTQATDSLSSVSSNGEGRSLLYGIITPSHPSRSIGFRIHAELVTDRLLQDAIYSVHDTLGRVLEFVAELDDRQFPRNYGYFVELEGELGVCHIPAC